MFLSKNALARTTVIAAIAIIIVRELVNTELNYCSASLFIRRECATPMRMVSTLSGLFYKFTSYSCGRN